MTVAGGGSGPMSQGGGLGGGHQSTNLGDILERVLDKGLVIAGDIQVNLLDIELLTIKVRLVIASLETAKEVGIDWWEHDPWLTGSKSSIEIENARLRERIAELESDRSVSPALGGAESIEVEGQRQDTDDDTQ
ncbi:MULTISPECIES: gas vesicle protein [Rhodococcus]|uniref:Gas vesicle protein n=1 Tax=Rhodococcus oxybenzonivorans TaxID=1990687 RepID=A0AAE4V3T9_9NOCA|nr:MULTISPECIES: gas vesicle protein [Rhodococcus]MDV7242959.1 gas vesicle protein [Rhodococcus oxybenzonivorans]MDV7268335.1 gas vesicle protein [Rhodococcus oxybenzonivorans]MDV7275363.1 gas vesicle protein [Rhodococcus oxybenzonivorans]MDV7334782.1 gas vesicle protein [Rhodococcus oxybenzonivorans]MDV7344936.1 gas vesicle protein [Rhodococcus oxybenzonivorans]